LKKTCHVEDWQKHAMFRIGKKECGAGAARWCCPPELLLLLLLPLLLLGGGGRGRGRR
jgi:hypothetical protein